MPVEQEELDALEEFPIEPEEEPLPEFDQRYAEDFVGLTFLGAISQEFEWIGHKFVIKTLSVDDYLAVGMLSKEYKDSAEMARAYITAVVALCIQTVDGQSLPTPIGEEKNSYAWAYQRFNYVKANWYPYTIDLVYRRLLDLEAQVEQVLESMGNASGWTESPTDVLNANSV